MRNTDKIKKIASVLLVIVFGTTMFYDCKIYDIEELRVPLSSTDETDELEEASEEVAEEVVEPEEDIEIESEEEIVPLNDDSSYDTYNSVEAMKATEFQAGETVYTKSYYEGLNKGGATYLIVTADIGKNVSGAIQLDSGLYAVLQPTDNTVSPSQYGAYGDGVNDDRNAIQKAISSGYTVVSDADQTYLMSKGLMIPSTSIFDGNNSTILVNEVSSFFADDSNAKENNGKGLFYYQFFMPTNYDTYADVMNWSNIDIEWNVEQDISQVTTYYLIMPRYVHSINFSNVTININGNEKNCIQPIKFNGSSDTVIVDSCNINNYTHGYAGGCLWFNVAVGGYLNFTATNCNFYSEAKDEAVSVWGRYGENVKFENCTISKKNCKCYNAKKTEQSVSPDVVLVTKASKRTNSDARDDSVVHNVEFINCTFLSSGDASTYFFSTNSYYSEKMLTTFNNCTISGKFGVSLMNSENTSDSVDGITNSTNNEDFINSLRTEFYNCTLDLETPTIATTHAPNFVFDGCTINNEKYALIDLSWPSNRLINCWKGVFTNNTIKVSTSANPFKNISASYLISIECTGNDFVNRNSKFDYINVVENDSSTVYTYRHDDGAKSEFVFANNE